MNLKQVLYDQCLNYVQQRMSRVQDEIKKVQASANEETKSSAGDKHETGRAMAQLEIEQNSKQLIEVEKLQITLQGIVTDKVSETVVPGSLITSSKGIFYMAISIGVIKHDQKEYFCIAPDSPVGKLFLGKRKGERFSWNNNIYTIQDIQ